MQGIRLCLDCPQPLLRLIFRIVRVSRSEVDQVYILLPSKCHRSFGDQCTQSIDIGMGRRALVVLAETE